MDCGKGPQHVSGGALSKSSWQPRDNSSGGEQRLTATQDQDLAQDSQDLGQDLAQDDTVTEPDSSSDDEEYVQDVVPAVMPRRRRRVRQEHLGPVVPNRLRQHQ